MPNDLVLIWQQELLRIAHIPDLPQAARKLVFEVVADFEREDAEAVERLAS